MAKTPRNRFPLLSYVDELVDELRENVPKAMKQWDEHAIHQARVATRRLKAALELLDPVLSDEHVKPFSKVLKKLRRRLGPMRDLDVMIGHLGDINLKAHANAIEWLTRRLKASRQAARDGFSDKGASARVLSRLGSWWGVREEVAEAEEAADSLIASSLHLQLDAFVEQADKLVSHAEHPSHEDRQDPHAVRISGKSLRYTLEKAEIQGHKLPGGVMGKFKKMQEALGLWHDYVVLTERAMQTSLEALLPHHDAELQGQVLDLARLLLRRSSQYLGQFTRLWGADGSEVARVVRDTFPLSQYVNKPQTDPDPPGSNGPPAPAEPIQHAVSNA